MAVRPALTVVPIGHNIALETEIHLETLAAMSRAKKIVGIAYVVMREDGTFYCDVAGAARRRPVQAHLMAAALWRETEQASRGE